MIDLQAAEQAVRSLLFALGQDPNREGLKDTPKRVSNGTPQSFEYYASVACNAISYLLFMEARYGETQRPELRPDPVG